MFKKLKDKLAEEVKSSPQRIQQFAQAAQAAVTSASSSISDITNNDLFSIGDNDTQKMASNKHSTSQQSERNTFQDISLSSPSMPFPTHTEGAEFQLPISEHQRQRKLSNSSFASDVSFKLPTYESPSMYHLQSDMDVSASEAEERLSGVNLERVTKEQVYSAYRRTQDRYAKYRARYADLARHYRTLERENAKARSVLVETQDKALRRISELREQCTLEQSAKAHLERSLRLEIDEKSMKIDALTTKLNCIKGDILHEPVNQVEINKVAEDENQLIDLSTDKEEKRLPETVPVETTTLNNKIEKMEQLISKFKESLKNIKEKNAHLISEITKKNMELENKTKENEQLSLTAIHLTEAREKIQELKELNEELENKVNSYEFSKAKEETVLKLDLQKALDEIAQLQVKILTLSKREEEYAFSLAENKLSIHKELESKESEIKSLKLNLDASVKEVQSLNIVINDYKTKITTTEKECSTLRNELSECSIVRKCIEDKKTELEEMSKKCLYLEQQITKRNEEYNCLELQVKQETAEKLALLDRNEYLEDRYKQTLEDISKKDQFTLKLEKDLQEAKGKVNEKVGQTNDEVSFWKDKCNNLEAEIQEEREELLKLQTEIEKLLKNYELVQNENSELHERMSQSNVEHKQLEQTLFNCNSDRNNIKIKCMELMPRLKEVKEFVSEIRNDVQTLNNFKIDLEELVKKSLGLFHRLGHESNAKEIDEEKEKIQNDYEISLKQIDSLTKQKSNVEARIGELELERTKFFNLLQGSENNLKVVEVESENLKHINKEIEIRCSNIESKYASSLNDLNASKVQYDLLSNEFEAFKSDKSEQHIASVEELETKNAKLQRTIANLKEKVENSDNLAETIKCVEEENVTLKLKFDAVSKTVRDLETSLMEVRYSHAEIEKEKDKFKSQIDQLEQNIETLKIHNIEENDKNNQILTDENSVLKIKCEQIKQEKEDLFEKILTLEQQSLERERVAAQNDELSKECLTLRSQLSELKEKLKDAIETFKHDSEMHAEERRLQEDNYSKLMEDFNILKDENKRFQSDIEGLQTYLTKISKENTTLNDQLRELIASSENPDKNDNSLLLEEKEKYNELLRQNTLLEEENLELKDQLQAQNYAPPIVAKVESKSESNANEEYSKIKTALETKLADFEYMNKTINENLVQEQEQNKKLRLNNEKLERRLDEALVSLRHLHSLQENTELEYLRNVLYEYLTGSGAHAVTLAKVLAAVVKFDDHQTQQILTKEKERQGVLRQLGLL